VLVERDEVVEHSHHRPLGVDRNLFMDRHARRAVGIEVRVSAMARLACRPVATLAEGDAPSR
jgi:hypothetical protein